MEAAHSTRPVKQMKNYWSLWCSYKLKKTKAFWRRPGRLRSHCLVFPSVWFAYDVFAGAEESHQLARPHTNASYRFRRPCYNHVPISENLRVCLTALKTGRTFPWRPSQTFWVKFSGKTPLTERSFFCSQWDSFTPMSQPSSCKTNNAIPVSPLTSSSNRPTCNQLVHPLVVWLQIDCGCLPIKHWPQGSTSKIMSWFTQDLNCQRDSKWD